MRLAEDDTLYTIISAHWDTDDEVSYRIFDIHQDVVRSMKEYPFDFHLLNDQAPGIENRAAHNRGYGDLAWGRDAETDWRTEATVKAHKLNNPGLLYYQALSKYLELVQEIYRRSSRYDCPRTTHCIRLSRQRPTTTALVTGCSRPRG